jgi:hypothetical protein
MFDMWCIKAYTIGVIHNAAFRFRERGLSLIAAVWPVLKTQGFVAWHFGPCAGWDTVLIGNVPTHGIAASHHAATIAALMVDPLGWARERHH